MASDVLTGLKVRPKRRANGSPRTGETSADLLRSVPTSFPSGAPVEQPSWRDLEAYDPQVLSAAAGRGITNALEGTRQLLGGARDYLGGFMQSVRERSPAELQGTAPARSKETYESVNRALSQAAQDPLTTARNLASAFVDVGAEATKSPASTTEFIADILTPIPVPSVRRGPPVSQVVKQKGGDFPKNLTPIESLNFKLPGDVVEQLPPVRRENLTKIMPAVNNWISTKLDRYIRTEMATPEDPIRKLAEQDILHVAPDTFGTFRQVIRYGKSGDERQLLGKSDTAKAWEDASDQALQTHRAQDIVSGAQGGTQRNQQNVDPYVARFLAGQVGQDQILAGNTPASLRQLDLKGGIYKDMLEEDPWIATVAQKDPNRPIYFPRKNLADDLGFRHLKDELFNSLRSDSDLPQQLRMTPEQLGRMSVPDAVRHVSKINRWREKQKAEANLALATNAATVPFKDYPNQKFGWFQLKANTPQGRRALEDALKYEGDMMGHCVGGYCEDVFSGRSEIYSLRNKKTGEPHVTIEVTPLNTIEKNQHYMSWLRSQPKNIQDEVIAAAVNLHDNNPGSRYGEQLNKVLEDRIGPPPKSIFQIKGKGDRKPNATYIPFVQDFVRSQNWMDIRELRNADLVDLKDTASTQNWINTKMATHVSPEALKSLQDEGVRFATIEELNARHSAMVKERVAARKAAESPEQKAARQQLRELRRAERRRERGE